MLLSDKTIKYLEELESTSGTNNKISIIKEAFQYEEFRQYMFYALHPYKRFNIGKVPEAIKGACHKPNNFDNIFNLLDWLVAKRGVSDADLNEVVDYLRTAKTNAPVIYKWLCKLITKSSIAGIGVSLVNKAMGYEFIPKFKCMLMDVVKMEDVTFPTLAQIKYDGFRCINIPGEGAIGRSGKPIVNKNVARLIKGLSTNYVTDGELYSHNLNFNEIASILRKENEPIPLSVHYVIYDAIHIDEWKAKNSSMIYSDRLRLMWNLMCANTNGSITTAETEDITNIDDLKVYYDSVLAKGYEGLVVKNPNGYYQWKRVTAKSGVMGKIKPSDYIDAKIIDRFEGKGEIIGRLGGFVVELEDTTVVRVGSGFTKEQRVEYWEDGFKFKGEWVRLGYTERTPDGNLRFPRLDSFRDNK
jgi:DNA ligase-1